jgi:hypothetical protein
VLQIETLKLYSQATVVAGNTYIESIQSDTDYSDFVQSGDFVYVEDTADSPTKNFVSVVSSVPDANTIILTESPSWTSAGANVYLARPISSAVVKQIIDSDTILFSDVDDNFKINKTLIGKDSYSVCSPSAININDRFNTGLGESFDFRTYNQMTRVEGSITGGPFTSDEKVFQIDASGDEVSSAFVHSSNSTSGSLYLTRVTGTIQTELDIEGSESLAVITAAGGITKYEGDLDPTSGTVIFLQNDIPVIRDENQSEEIRIILEF